MKRSMMQVYVRGSNEAVSVYQKAFDAQLVSEYKNDDGTYMHAELDVNGQIIALSEAARDAVPGNTMQFCFHYDKGHEAEIERAYNILKEGGKILFPLGECFFSPLMMGIIDKFGVNWCLFI